MLRLETAIARFDAALAEPGTAFDESVGWLASVGRGRALLDLGQFADAAAAVAAVPTEFQYVTEHAESPLRLQNAIWSYSVGWLWSVSDEEGGTGLPYRTAEDPRVPYQDEESSGLDGTTPQFTLLKYPDASASVVLADGIEARLFCDPDCAGDWEYEDSLRRKLGLSVPQQASEATFTA